MAKELKKSRRYKQSEINTIFICVNCWQRSTKHRRCTIVTKDQINHVQCLSSSRSSVCVCIFYFIFFVASCLRLIFFFVCFFFCSPLHSFRGMLKILRLVIFVYDSNISSAFFTSHFLSALRIQFYTFGANLHSECDIICRLFYKNHERRKRKRQQHKMIERRREEWKQKKKSIINLNKCASLCSNAS